MMGTIQDSIHILYVDDDLMFAEMAATFLERKDERFVMEIATDADEGLNRFRDDEFDCIISDYDMPGQNGIEFLQTVRQKHPDFPFILYTGKGSEEVAAEAISSGVTDYVQKETGSNQYAILANRVRNAVSARRSATEVQRSRYRLEQILKTVPSCVVQLNYEGDFIFANERAVDVLGLEETAVTNRTYNDPEWEIRDLDGSPIPEEELPFRQVRDSGEPVYGFRHSINWPDGSKRILNVNGAPLFDDTGEIESVVFSLTDITEQWDDEKCLQQTTARLQALFDSSPDMINVHDVDGNIVDPNPRLCEETGYDKAELQEMKVWELDERLDPKEAHALWEGMEPGDQKRLEGLFLRHDGSTFPVEVHVRRLSIDDEDQFMVISRDISEREEREQEYDRIVELLDRTERIAAVGGWEIDSRTEEVFWSDNLFEMLGWEDDDEPPLEEALDVYLEEDRPRVENVVEDALRSGDSFAIEARVQRPDGEIRWVDTRGEPSIENGEVVAVRGAVHDITGRKRREDVLREVYDTISNHHRSFEEKAQALLKLGRAELDTEYGTLSKIRGEEYVFEFVDAEDESIQPGEVVPVSATTCELAASTEQTLVFGDIERDAPEETDRASFTEWGISCYIGAPVFVEDDVYGTFCFYDTGPRGDQFSDWEETLVDLMSSWVSNELQRQQASDRLKTQNEQLEQFASVVSHDLRNPLNVAEGRLELAEEECDSEHLTEVNHALDRMNALIDDLLTLAREGEQVDELDPVDVARLTETCWRNVATSDATLTTEIDRRIQANQRRLQQLFENLMRNAVEHGGEDVTVTIGALDDGFYVEDDGPGISDEEQTDVFEAGYSTAEDGTGLGLSIVEQVAHAHGWNVRATNGFGGGARFEVTGVKFTAE